MANKTKVKKLYEDTNTIEGIEKAEREKARLENAGWGFVKTIVIGLGRFVTIYKQD